MKIKEHQPSASPLVLIIACSISMVYWQYLLAATKGTTTDLIGYADIGRMLHSQGWAAYFKTGPNREPLYPLLISWAMDIEPWTGIAYSKITAIFGLFILTMVQVLTYIFLKQLNIRTWICWLALLYLGLSETLASMAIHQFLFSEIMVYPLIPMLVLAGHRAWNGLKERDPLRAGASGALVGALFAIATFVKAVFEIIFPAYLIILLIAAICKKNFSFSLICFLAVAGLLFYVPIVSFKLLNKEYNGHFTFTNRGPEVFSGNVIRRTGPLTTRQYLADIALVPSVCGRFFKPQECDFWSYTVSDQLGGQKISEFGGTILGPPAALKRVLLFCQDRLMRHFPQYFLLTVIEGLKAFFWGSYKIVGGAFIGLSLIYCTLTFKRLPALMGHVLAMVFLYVLFHAMGCILPRYILPIVPLYVIIISYSLNSVLNDTGLRL